MFKNLISSKKFLFVLASVALLTLFLSLLPKKEPTPKLTEITPPNQSSNFSVIGTVVATYDLPVDSTKFNLSSEPEALWDIRQSGEKSLEFKSVKPLQRYTKYSLYIDWGGQVLYTLSFTTQDTQQDYEVIQNVKDEIAKNYPLAKLIPHSTSQYRVVYSGPLTLEITLKNINLTSAEVIEEVKSWVDQNGGNTSAHKYVIATPSPTPTN